MENFIAVDWGSTHFRAFLVDRCGEVIDRVDSDKGIKKVADLTQSQKESVLLELTKPFQQNSLNCRYLLCGMAGSNVGLQTVPYLKLPLALHRLKKNLAPIASERISGWIVPGLQGLSSLNEVDVMRGEETQLLGWENSALSRDPAIICLPGTHSKWVEYQQGIVTQFDTHISGELYHLLSTQSFMVEGEQVFCQETFIQGVQRTLEGEPLNQILFSCRSRMLSNQLKKYHTGAYLSGLIIGSEIASELAALRTLDSFSLSIIGSKPLSHLYQLALTCFGVNSEVHCGELMVVAGLSNLYQAVESSAQLSELPMRQPFKLKNEDSLS